MTTILDLLAGALLVACAYLASGLAAACGMAGVLLLVASWKASR